MHQSSVKIVLFFTLFFVFSQFLATFAALKDCEMMTMKFMQFSAVLLFLVLTLKLLFLPPRHFTDPKVNRSRWMMAGGTGLIALQFLLQHAFGFRQMGVTQAVCCNLLFFTPTLTLPTSLSNLFRYSNGLFILPLLAGASQFFMTQIMNGKKKDKNADKNAVPTVQQKEESAAADAANAMNNPMMKWFFPLFSIWICATSNAAFSIYWMAANVIQIVQQLVVNAWFERQDAKAAQAGNPNP